MKPRTTFLVWVSIFIVVVFMFLIVTQQADAQENIYNVNGTEGIGLCPVQHYIYGYTTQEFSYGRSFYIDSISLNLSRSSGATGELVLYITDPYFSIPLASSTVDISTLPVGYEDRIDFDFDNVQIDANDEWLMYIYPDPPLSREYVFVESLKLGYDNGEENCIGEPTIDDTYDVTGIIKGYIIEPQYLFGLIPVAHASTTCEFIIDGNTTTAECSDPIMTVKNTTQDIFNGILFLFGTIVLTIIGFEFIFNRRNKLRG